MSAPAVATIIDVHTHVVPASFPANPSPDSNTRWPCMCMRGADQAVIEFAGKAFRELDARSWDVTRRIDDMDRDGIAAQVLSPMPELLSYWFSPGDGLELARYVNQQIAEMMARAPRRLHGLGMVPMQDVELACAELARLKADGFKGVQLGSNINGVMPGDARFLPFYAECERLDMAVFVHALHPVGAERLKDFPDLVPFAAFPLDTGLAAMHLIRAGVLERHARLRIGFSHGGGAVIPLTHRLKQGWLSSAGFNGLLPHSPHHYAARCYYDSLVYDVDYLRYLMCEFAPGQVFAGSDYPYAIAQTDLAGFLDAAAAADSSASAAVSFLAL
ncbi:MAG: amidohydrolase family protein [Gammaproteobacteria bacterium]|nr:amidohydrolase family protein [Gammaproteobacteria bacterium]